MDLGELASLMPADGPGTFESMTRWLSENPEIATLSGGRAYLPNRPNLGASAEGEALRTRAYLRAAKSLVQYELRPILPFLECALVTGSTAYGTPKPDDDCDLFLITRHGTLWLVLAFVYLRLRLSEGSYRRDGPPVWCLNFVLDEEAAALEFQQPRGFLFAREALSAIPLVGEDSYSALLARASWLEQEAPRLYARWSVPRKVGNDTRGSSRPVRFLNAIAFLGVATYLQCVGLYRNWRLRREGRLSDLFTTTTHPNRLSINSAKFEELGKLYRGSSALGADP
jgi:hypothetical protein